MRGEESGGIGAGAEERGMAQGDDPGIAQDQIGRQREQDRRQYLRAERQIVGKEKIGGERSEPRQRLERAIAVAPGKDVDRRAARLSRRAAGHARPNRPRGRHSRIAIVRA